MAQATTEVNPAVNHLKRVGPHLADQLKKAGIHTLLDLCCHLPKRYIEPAWLMPLNRVDFTKVDQGERVYVVGKVKRALECFSKTKQQCWFELTLRDGESEINAVWQDYSLKDLESTVRLNHYAILAGNVEGEKLVDCQTIPLGADYPWPIGKTKCVLYPRVEGIPHAKLQAIIALIVAHYRHRLDYLADNDELKANNLMLPSTAFYSLHLDWPGEELKLLNAGRSQAHKTVRFLREHAKQTGHC